MNASPILRISELMVRYGTRTDAKGRRFLVFDRETGTTLDGDFETEDMAKAGARLRAAAEIYAVCRAGAQ